MFPAYTREMPRFSALAGAVLRQAADLMALTGTIPAGFSFGAAEGAQLDDLAAASGLTRETGMTDEAFRAFCLAKLSLWTWDGTNAGVPAALSALPGVTERTIWTEQSPCVRKERGKTSCRLRQASE